MASLRDIRKRVRSVKSSEKITKAMKMVAAAKLKRAQEEVRRARPYADKMDHVVAHLANRLEAQGEAAHPLLVNRAEKKRVEIVVLTSDRGLCGAFNSNIIRRAQRLMFDIKPLHQEVRISTLGKKGYDAFRREGLAVRTNYTGILERPSYAKAAAISEEICNSYINDELDAVYLVYNEFKSAISQKVTVKQLLPIVPQNDAQGDGAVDYVYEPSQVELLSQLLPRHFATQLFQSFLESVASEYGARMTAMDNATRNAKEMISSLTLQYNRARQAAITKELMEIIGGAEALSS
jgi:F-type H+-transporting ATPase subunit gamma